MANHEAFLTIRQAAEILGLQYHQLQRGIKAGIFPAYRVGGRPAPVHLSTRRIGWRVRDLIVHLSSNSGS